MTDDESAAGDRITTVDDLASGDRVRVRYKDKTLRNQVENVGEVKYVTSFDDSVSVTVEIDSYERLNVNLRVDGQTTVESMILGEPRSFVGDCAFIDVIDADTEEVAAGDDV